MSTEPTGEQLNSQAAENWAVCYTDSNGVRVCMGDGAILIEHNSYATVRPIEWLSRVEAELTHLCAERDELLQKVKRFEEWKNGANARISNDSIERIKLVEQNKDLRDALRVLANAIEDLANHSTGVAGLHLNGDMAEWDELMPGGRYEEWLSALGTAKDLLRRHASAEEKKEKQ